MEKGSAKTGIAIAAIVALVIGGGVGYAAGMGMDNNQNDSGSMSVSENQPNTSTKAADLRTTMNNLLREHVSASLDVTRDIADGDEEARMGSVAAQTANAVAIAGAVGSIYGEEAEAQITDMFVEHITASNEYAEAVQAGDDAAKNAAQEELDEYLVEISQFFSGAISTLPQDTVFSLLSEHETLLNQSVVAYNEGNFERSYELEREALTQVSGIADALSKGIVETQADKF